MILFLTTQSERSKLRKLKMQNQNGLHLAHQVSLKPWSSRDLMMKKLLKEVWTIYNHIITFLLNEYGQIPSVEKEIINRNVNLASTRDNIIDDIVKNYRVYSRSSCT